MVKLLVCYVHLLATCIALGSVVVTDWWLFKGRLHQLRAGARGRLIFTTRVVQAALVVLWITGIALVWLSYLENPLTLLNQKLWGKIAVVIALSFNGLVLHRAVFPRLINDQLSFSDLTNKQQREFAALGAVSSASWLFAAFIGVARQWNFAVTYTAILALYFCVLIVAVGAAVTLCPKRKILRLKRKARIEVDPLTDS